ncbi:hypothetical protein ACGFIV_00800 [Sphaerisporangium sp. NPDC049003]|uniref:hypothetical protein n=1 Tax=Sphaerisporangium sp. NPDC049003 TaxID=3364517 RepID=UPI00371FBDD9
MPRLIAPPPAAAGRWGSPARTRRLVLIAALALPTALAWLQLTAASPAVTHPPVIVRTGMPPTPFVTVSPHMESR